MRQNYLEARRYYLSLNRVKTSRGFTLVEMLIVSIIIGIVTTISLVGYKSYGANLNVRRSANEMALAIREAQANALAVKGYDHDNNSGTPLLFTSWGINFTSASNNQFTMFVDHNSEDRYYNASANPTERVKSINILNGVKILDLCKGQKNPSIEAPQCGLTSLDIVYQRPNPDTTLRANNPSTCAGGACPDVEIILQGTDGGQRTVVVWSTGQISVE